MTKKEFYEALAQKTKRTKANWAPGLEDFDGLFNTGLLRLRVATPIHGYHCPLSFVAGTTPCNIEEAADVLNMTREDAAVIAGAADGGTAGAYTGSRDRLLKACGLPSV